MESVYLATKFLEIAIKLNRGLPHECEESVQGSIIKILKEELAK